MRAMSQRTNVESPAQPMFREGVVKSIPSADDAPAEVSRTSAATVPASLITAAQAVGSDPTTTL